MAGMREAFEALERWLQQQGEWMPVMLFVSIFVFVMPLVAKMGGWSLLAQHYAVQLPFAGQRFRFRSAQLRGHTNYGNCMTFGADSFSLYMAVIILFRVGHPPLLIPWQDVTMREVRAWLVPAVEMRFAKEPQINVRISRRLAEELLASAGSPIRIQPAEC